MAAPPRYAYAIPSLSETVPNLPPLGNLDVNRAIFPGTPIDRANLAQAKAVVKGLQAAHDSPLNHGVTEDMVDAANLRMLAVEGAHVAAEYAPGLITGIAAILERLTAMEARLGMIETDGKIAKAIALNQRLISRNARNQPRFVPLHKTVPGSGFELAISLTSIADRRNLHVPAQIPAVGDIPPNFVADITTYSNRDIYQLIIFYNETFGIIAADDVAARRIKLIEFLSHY